MSMRARALTSMPTLFYSKKNRVGVLTSARAPALTSTQTLWDYPGVNQVEPFLATYWCTLFKCQPSFTKECQAIAAITTPQYCNFDLHAIPTLHSMI